MKSFEVGNNVIAVYNLGGTFYATDNECTHGAASLADGILEDDIIECTLHFGAFNVKTGEAVQAPCFTRAADLQGRGAGRPGDGRSGQDRGGLGAQLMRRPSIAIFCAALFAATAAPAAAQDYPTRPDHTGAAVSRRQRHRRDRAARRRQSVEPARPAGGRREQGRRQRRAGGDRGRPLRAGRLHDLHDDEFVAVGGAVPAEVDPLRSGEGFRAGRAHGQSAVHHGDRPLGPGQRLRASSSPTPRPIPAS